MHLRPRNVANDMLQLSLLILLAKSVYATPTSATKAPSVTAQTEDIGASALAASAAAAVAASYASVEESHRGSGKDADANLMFAKSHNLLFDELKPTNGQLINLTRQHDGDVFRTNGVINCNADSCVGLSSGTAGLMRLNNERSGHDTVTLADGTSSSQLELLTRRLKLQQQQLGAGTGTGAGEACECRCLPYLPTYREDLGICVDDIHECTLSPFVSGSSSEKIPLVILPLRGQIIHPSREINFPDIHTPVCAVTGAQYLTFNGWSDLRNPVDTDYPFRMFRDEGRTFLQWLGESDLRQRMQGRLIVVHLVCRDMTIAFNATSQEQIMPPKNVFSPCVAFRVNGSPVKSKPNVPFTTFQSETTTPLASTNDGMTTKEYIVIGVCSLLLGLIYVSSVFLYLHMKKRKNRDQSHLRNSLDDLANEINYPKNDQVTFGAPFNRAGSIYSATSMGTTNEPRSRASIGSLKDEIGIGIVKNNPLLQHFPQLGEHNSGFASDISNSNSECEMDGDFHDKLKQMQTSALVHPQLGMNSNGNGSPKGGHAQSNSNVSLGNDKKDTPEQDELSMQENECLPAENVAIIEDMMSEEKLESLRAMVNGNIRKKLYFNPAYFEPQLLAEPPQAALEFLQKIREVIAIAKYKMATKRYQPSLIMIPEEAPLGSNASSIYSSQLQQQSECEGCAINRCSGHVKNCGEKRNTIEKWLQSVPGTESQLPQKPKSAAADNDNQRNGGADDANKREQSPAKNTGPATSKSSNSSAGNRSSPRKEIVPPKERPPPPPVGKSSTTISANNRSQKNEQAYSKSPEINENIKADDTGVSAVSTKNQQYCTKISTGSAVSIAVKRNYESFSALSAAANVYGFAETGSEIYNNPKFALNDSPAASQRSHSSHRSKCSRKRLDALDQFAAASTPTSLNSADRQHYNKLRNMKQIPEMLYDSLSREYNCRVTANSSFHLDIPTPDYDSTMEKKIKDIYSSTQSSIPSVPTPDYSSLSRKSLKQFQPDSPIYRRKSPQYLIVDYETDSLERLEATKRKSSHSSSSPSSDVSSQLSPSLSTALPLEEELEISHTVYDRIDGFRKEGDVKKKVVNKPANTMEKNKEMAARIKYDTPFLGSMTIEVEHEPPSDLERTDSDQFEPDTLDRKPKKQSFCDVNDWSNRHQNSQKSANGNYDDDTEYAQQINSLPELSRHASPSPDQGTRNAPFVLRSSTSFRSQIDKSPIHGSQSDLHARKQQLEDATERRENFNHLREIYQSPLSRQNSQSSCKCGVQATEQQQKPATTAEQGRLLTLEAKHSKRQRVIEQTDSPAIIEITKVNSNKTTIKISTPKAARAAVPPKPAIESAIVEPLVHQSDRRSPSNLSTHSSATHASSVYAEEPKNYTAWCSNHTKPEVAASNQAAKTSVKRKSPPPPLPPGKTISKAISNPVSASKAPNSENTNDELQNHYHHYQNQRHFLHQESSTNANEEESMSTHSESTEITGVSDTLANSEFENSCNNTLSSIDPTPDKKADSKPQTPVKQMDSPPVMKKLKNEHDYGAMFNTKINGLRNDYSLTKYLNRRKSQDYGDPHNDGKMDDAQFESNNNSKNLETDPNKSDVLSISSRSNHSSSRLSDRTKEMYRNAGVPVGIAYPQRSSSNSNTSASASNNVQTVYRCEIEPVQLTAGMQIAMGLKDRAKKAKDLKNAWRKFVSLAASKFSPSQSPAPPFDSKKASNFLEVLDRDDGISSLIDDQPQVSTPKSSYSAPASQNYYEQRFGSRPGEMDSGYMSADSTEVYKRSFYDRYNFKMMSARDRVIRVDTIDDNSDGASTITDRHNGEQALSRRHSIIEANRFEDLENIVSPQSRQDPAQEEETSDCDSDKTLTRANTQSARDRANTITSYSSEEEQGHSTCCGSSETDGETNPEDMWESGAESIETHSVLYKMVRKN